MNIVLSKLISVAIQKLRRIITVNGIGKYDPRTAHEATPYGVDSSPVKDMVAVYAFTGSDDDQVALGYINKEALAKQGELRVFSTDAAGSFKFNLWLRDDGTLLIGDSKIPAAYIDNLVKWTALNTALQAQLVTINSNFTALYALLGTPAPVVAIDITAAKTTTIKTN